MAAYFLLIVATGTAGVRPCGVGAGAKWFRRGLAGSLFELRAAGPAVELVLTAGFLIVILGSTDKRAPSGFAPIAIGLALTLIHLVSIPVTNTSVNPARSTGPALVVGGLAPQQLWLFWLAPVLGGVVGGAAYRMLFAEAPERPDIAGEEPAAR